MGLFTSILILTLLVLFVFALLWELLPIIIGIIFIALLVKVAVKVFERLR